MAHEIFLVLKGMLHIHPSYQVPVSVAANSSTILVLRIAQAACKAPEETRKHQTESQGQMTSLSDSREAVRMGTHKSICDT